MNWEDKTNIFFNHKQLFHLLEYALDASNSQVLIYPLSSWICSIAKKTKVMMRQSTFVFHHASHPWSNNRFLIWMVTLLAFTLNCILFNFFMSPVENILDTDIFLSIELQTIKRTLLREWTQTITCFSRIFRIYVCYCSFVSCDSLEAPYGSLTTSRFG